MAPFFFTTSSAIPHPSRHAPAQGEFVTAPRRAPFLGAPLRVAPPRRSALFCAAPCRALFPYALSALAADLLVELAAPLRLHRQPALPAADEATLPARLAHRHAAELGLAERAPSCRPPCRHLQFRCRATAQSSVGPLGFSVRHLSLVPE